MGAFVSALAAAQAPERVEAVVLVDGGLAFPPPSGADIDAIVESVIGPAMTRLRMRFAGPAASIEFWREHPAVGPLLAADADGHVEGYLLHDLRPLDDSSGDRVSTCVLDAIRQDGGDVLTNADVHGAVRSAVAAGVPTSFIWAERGLLVEPQGLYEEHRIAALDLPAELSVRRSPGTNHYGIVFEPEPVSAVVELLEDALDRS